jgi:hypothetical protein
MVWAFITVIVEQDAGRGEVWIALGSSLGGCFHMTGLLCSLLLTSCSKELGRREGRSSWGGEGGAKP